MEWLPFVWLGEKTETIFSFKSLRLTGRMLLFT
jgi:hypothetical protein